MYPTNSNQHQERPKRLIFAEQIRRRDRQEKLSQIRFDHGIRQQAWQILNSGQINVHQLGQIIKDKPSNEAGVSSAVSEWLRQGRKSLCMRSVVEITGWAQILCCVVEYECSMVTVVVEYLDVLMEAGQRIGQMEHLFLLMCTIMNIIEFPGRYPQSSQLNVKQGIRKYAQELVVSTISVYHLFKIGCNQLKFYTRFLWIYPEHSNLLASNRNFLSRICGYLEAGIDQKTNIAEIFKILMLVTYYEGQFYEGVTEELAELGCLSHIMFFVEFARQPDWTDALCEALSVIDNMLLNVGVQYFLDIGIMTSLINIISEPSQASTKLVQACIQTYLSIVEHIENRAEQLEYIREQNAMQEILTILEKYGPYKKQVQQNCYYAIIRILNIGQQIRQSKQAQINPYLLNLKYNNASELFTKFQLFEDLLARYGIEG